MATKWVYIVRCGLIHYLINSYSGYLADIYHQNIPHTEHNFGWERGAEQAHEPLSEHNVPRYSHRLDVTIHSR